MTAYYFNQENMLNFMTYILYRIVVYNIHNDIQFKDIEKFTARPSDVIIASFPKSGTTWVQEIVHQISMLQAAKQALRKENSDALVS